MQAGVRILANRYEVGTVVGRGTYGMVCRGVDRRTGQPVALKMMAPTAGEDPTLVERMLREQQALVALSGTCAVTAIDMCRTADGGPCLVMEWLEGRDLESQLQEWEGAGVQPGYEPLLEILRPLVQTLYRAHEIGLVHRDIKPANIFLTSGERAGVRLLDFGLSRMKSSAPITELGMVMGSPSYIAPETWGGNSALVDHRADLYSLAVIVFRWFAGKPPFDTPNLLNKMLLVTTSERPSLRALRQDLPEAMDPWIQRALAISPDQRFQSSHELYSALAEVLKPGSPTLGVQSEITDGGARAATAPSERPGILATAWSAATSLLRRFTAPSDSQPTHAPPAAPTPPTSPTPPTEESSGVWLDAADLEESAPTPLEQPAELESPPAIVNAGQKKRTRSKSTKPSSAGTSTKSAKSARGKVSKAQATKAKAAKPAKGAKAAKAQATKAIKPTRTKATKAQATKAKSSTPTRSKT
ncbi:MAG: serine/threonine-protein kinase [Polyangiaceae bacterium]|nr:serine/threonine-protein kinase [Polyangiaceae bacterium]